MAYTKKTINMCEMIAPLIGSRDVVEDLKKKVKKANTKLVELDFNEVEFVSRSAAHQLLSIKEDLKKKKDIVFINTNNGVAEMLRTVAANRAVSKEDDSTDDIDISEIRPEQLVSMAA